MGFLEQFFDQKDKGEQIDDQIPNILQMVERNWTRASEKLRGIFGSAYEIDEIALWFKDASDMSLFATRLARREGFILFNGASDEVETFPIRSRYDVSYLFMSTPAGSYRLELMNITRGFSPVHGVFETFVDGNISVVTAHASFKVATEEDYANAVRALKGGDHELLMRCESSYGQFSYWDDGVKNSGCPPLKPRWNKRDAEVTA